jgi:hypothetical protein
VHSEIARWDSDAPLIPLEHLHTLHARIVLLNEHWNCGGSR